MVIIGIDPGYAIVGYGTVARDGARLRPMRYGAITTPAKMKFAKRLQMIYEDMCELLDTTGATVMSIEKLFFNSNKTTGIDVSQARGVILLAAQQRGLDIYEYTPIQVKQAVVGYGRAEKRQVIEMTRQILGLDKPPRLDDTADALALAVCHANCAGSLLTKAMRR